jgi:peptidyl-prolyl cis-trans isomerase B (cyclophilin B)
MKKSIIIITILIFIGIICFFIFNKDSKTYTYEYNVYTSNGEINKETLTYTKSKKITNYVRIETSMGDIFVELYPDIAPKTVSNFKALVKSGFYKDMIFHRVIKNFMIQTGDPTGTGSGGAPNKIKGEFKSNGVENNLEHKRGVISMARANGQNDSASSQFFIMHKDNEDLNGDYAAFGNTIAGLEVVDKIATVKTNKNDKPLEDIKLNSIKFVNIIDE